MASHLKMLPFAGAVSLLLAGTAFAQNEPTALQRLFQQLQTAATPAPTFEFTGKLVTLKVDKVPLRDALLQLRAQSGMQFSMNRNGPNPGAENTPVTLDVKDKPLWDTLRALVGQTSASPAVSWVINDPTSGGSYNVSGLVCNSGPFLIFTNRITHVMDYSQPAGQEDSLQLQLMLLTDSTVRLNTITQQGNPTRAVDDNKNSLIPTKTLPESRINYGVSSGINIIPWTVRMKYSPPPTAGASVSRILATLEGTIPASFTFTQDLEATADKAVEKHYDGFTVSMEITTDPARVAALGGPTVAGRGRAATATPAPGAVAAVPTTTYVVTKITRDGNSLTPASADAYNNVSNSLPRLLDANGNAWRLTSRSTSSSGANSRTTTAGFTNAGNVVNPATGGTSAIGPAVKVIMQVPASTRETMVPFRFENIPLP